MSTKQTTRMGKARGQIKNTGDPRGQFAAFLRDWLDRHGNQDALLASAIKKKPRTIRDWRSGRSGPGLGELGLVAAALGYRDWVDLAIAVRRFNGK